MKTVEEILQETVDICDAATHPESEWNTSGPCSERWLANRENNAAFIRHCNPAVVRRMAGAIATLLDGLEDYVKGWANDNDLDDDAALVTFEAHRELIAILLSPPDTSDKH